MTKHEKLFKALANEMNKDIIATMNELKETLDNHRQLLDAIREEVSFIPTDNINDAIDLSDCVCRCDH